MKIIDTVEGLREVVLGENALVAESTVGTQGGDFPEVFIMDGELNLRDTMISGLVIRFKNCKVTGGTEPLFDACNLYFSESTLSSVRLSYCVTTLSKCTATCILVQGGILKLVNADQLTDSVITATVDVRGADTSIKKFNAYKGEGNCYLENLYYFKDSDTVVANYWQGKTEDFKEKAQQQGVAKDKYEAVYNYFKAFK